MLPNKHYYSEIAAEMAAMEKPRVIHAMEAMRRKGNKLYIRAFKEIDKDVLQKKFDPVYTLHEITHIAGNIGHTPDHEFWGMAMELGVLYGAELKDAHPTDVIAHKKTMEDAQTHYEELWKNSHAPETKYTPVSKRDMAIYTAAGMYLRQKIEAYVLNCEDMRYNAQQQFCNDYTKHDSEPVKQHSLRADAEDRRYFDRIQRAPYDLLRISKEEWRAIEGVALGMTEPRDTMYPERLAPIKEALIHADLFFDRPKFVEELKKKQAKGEQGITP